MIQSKNSISILDTKRFNKICCVPTFTIIFMLTLGNGVSRNRNGNISVSNVEHDFEYNQRPNLVDNFGRIMKEVYLGSLPENKQQINTMENIFKVGLVITLTQESRLPEEWFVGQDDIRNLWAPIRDLWSPTVTEVDSWLEEIRKEVVDRNKNVFIHCGQGNGRTGVVAAACLLKWGFVSIKEAEKMRIQGNLLPYDVKLVLSFIRQQRPDSVEMPNQERFLKAYYEHLWNSVDRSRLIANLDEL
jgi:protein-tyrosine phosphatase